MTDVILRRLEAIEARNRAVEHNKRWETSWTRRLSIAAATYVAAYCYLAVIGEPRMALAACVPTGGFLLSSLSLPHVRTLWEKRCKPQLSEQLTNEGQ